MLEAKRMIREKVLAARDRLTEDERHRLSLKIRDRFFALPQVAAAQQIALFLAFGSEVDTWLFLDQALALGKDVAAPVTLPKAKELAFYPIRSRDEARQGHWGIYEPRREGEPIPPGRVDIVVVPGAVFDKRGCRIGYGGGYYDRFLGCKALGAWKVGICFDLQLLDEVPRAEHDVPVDVVLTETRTVVVGRG
ncbi:MAG: 5-formyltetrahydrofolate cyclo-ligase [Firmicutes bacterium]|jgi:5-formyltetrahydrofolate cyclo-ligase|nr:5-formyltetrahydrofolate cyclo-ligase [Bacillota bacterium]